MVWRLGSSPFTFGRFVMRHRLYIFGTFAWVLTGSLVITSLKWIPHAQGVAEHPIHITVAKPDAPKPQVAGAETTVPAPASTPVSVPAPASKPVASVSKVVSLVISQDSGAPANNPSPIASILPELPPAPTTPVDPTPPTNPTPPVDPTPTPPQPPAPTPPPAPACTLDPLLNFSLLGSTAVTVTAGTTSLPEVITTSDASSVTWTPSTAIVWGDGSSSDATASVKLAVSYLPGTLTGSTITFAVQALATATPGTYTVTWHVTDATRAICYNMSVQVTVVGILP